MAGTRDRLHKSAPKDIQNRPTRRTRASRGVAGVPVVFQDLLEEEQVSLAADEDEDSRPLKKRKTAQQPGTSNLTATPEPELAKPQHYQYPPRPEAPSQAHFKTQSHFQEPSQPGTPMSIPSTANRDETGSTKRVRQTIIDSDESDESDLEWEDALAEGDDSDDRARSPDAQANIGDISITMGPTEPDQSKSKRQIRRRAITSVDKKLRLDIHKMHVLCLLYHVHRRNAWCNDGRVQAILRKLPAPKTLSNLVPNPEANQYQTSKRFIDGMNELKLLWSKRFTVSAQGMYTPRWVDPGAEAQPLSDFDELDDPMDRSDFRRAAAKLEGSQDVGAQLFCALLRGIGIEARLICSLQCLPFASAAQPSTTQKPSAQKNTIYLDPYNEDSNASPSKPKATMPRPKRLSRLERVLGERHPVLNAGVAPKQKKTYHTAYPVYWVEAFNSAHQKWVPIDPLSTFTVNAPEKLEPPLSFAQNSLTYAVAFEDDYSAKDVTRRYAKAYNAKTRKFRVESTPDGDKWWKRVMRIFKRSIKLDRDQVEDAALARKEASEGIPKNVQDFKDHPVYVLERHLKHNQVIHPKNQVGKVNVGTAMNPNMEPIYRRRDVHIVRSADKWYRLGRDIKDGEQPLKHAKPKKSRRPSLGADMDIEDQQDEVGTALYAEFQTELYVPPPVIRGRVPRNAFGNLDLYVPSMCPAGGVHIRHKLASKAARIVGVDYSEAVTGFTFKGRHGTAIVQGVVVAQEFAEAVEAVIDAMVHAQEEAEHLQRRSEALRMWRRLYLGLRIAQRVNAIEIDGETGPVINVQEEIDKEEKDHAEKEFAGGFFPDENDATERPQHVYHPPIVPDEEDEEGGGFIPKSGDEGGFVPESFQAFGSRLLAEQQLRPRRPSSHESGFVPGDDEDGDFLDNQSRIEHERMRVGEDPVRSLNTDNIPEPIDGRHARPEAEPLMDIDRGSVRDKASLQGGGSGSAEDVIEELAKDGQQSESAEAIPQSNSQLVSEQQNTAAYTKPSPPSSSPSDVGSLPMEDPEDEDADPDWLVDAT